MSTRVELRKATAESRSVPFTSPIKLSVILEVFERAPSKPIDVCFTWSPIWEEPVDQVLDEMEVGPLLLGKQEFVLESDPPVLADIPDPTGPTALLVTFSYCGRQFLHLGFNVLVEFEGEMPETFAEGDVRLQRRIIGCVPNRKEIQWDAEKDDDIPKDKRYRQDSAS